MSKNRPKRITPSSPPGRFRGCPGSTRSCGRIQQLADGAGEEIEVIRAEGVGELRLDLKPELRTGRARLARSHRSSGAGGVGLQTPTEFLRGMWMRRENMGSLLHTRSVSI